MGRRIVLALRISFTYIGTVVGAGFASGQEIFQFFTRLGSDGTAAILVAAFLFGWLGARLMVMGSRFGDNSCQQINSHLFGERMGTAVTWFLGLSLFGVTTAMLAGTGALFEEQLNFSYHIGVLLSIGAAYFILYRGMGGILSINSYIVPLMIVFMLLILAHNCQHPSSPSLLHPWLPSGNWLLAAVSYASFNIVLSQSVLVPLGASIGDPVALRWGGWLGGFILGGMLLICNMALRIHYHDISQLEIPMAYIIGTWGPVIKVLFLLVMWGEIFSTLVGNVFGLTHQLDHSSRMPKIVSITLIFALGYLLSMVGFHNLVRYLYPLCGYLGLIFLGLLIWRPMPAKRGG